MARHGTEAHDRAWATCYARGGHDGHLVLLIDLDECGALGRDTNDILRVVAAISGGLRGANQARLLQVGVLLANPRLLGAYTEIQSRSALPVEIAFYTQKAPVLACLRECAGYRMPYIAEGVTSTIFLPSGDASEHYQYLSNRAPERAEIELDRLGMVTWGASFLLKLKRSAGVYVTEGRKDLGPIARHMGAPKECVFLFDDKSVGHAALLNHLTPYAGEHMLPVEPFHFATIGEPHARGLEALLERHFPATRVQELDPGLYYEAAMDPSWGVEFKSLNAEGRWTIHKPEIIRESGAWVVEGVFSRKSSRLANALLSRRIKMI